MKKPLTNPLNNEGVYAPGLLNKFYKYFWSTKLY